MCPLGYIFDFLSKIMIMNLKYRGTQNLQKDKQQYYGIRVAKYGVLNTHVAGGWEE